MAKKNIPVVEVEEKLDPITQLPESLEKQKLRKPSISLPKGNFNYGRQGTGVGKNGDKKKNERIVIPDFKSYVQTIDKYKDHLPQNYLEQRGMPQGTGVSFEEFYNKLGNEFRLSSTTNEYDLLSKYNTAVQAAEEARRRNQPIGDQILGFVNQTLVGEILGGTLEGIGYLLDWQDVKDASNNVQKEYGNWLSDIGIGLKEWTREATPIYEDDPGTYAPSDLGWWLSNGVSVASTLSIMIPAAGWAKGTSMLARGGARLSRAIAPTGRLGKGLKTLSKAENPASYGWITTGLNQAIASRHAESMMESSGIFEQEYEKMISLGKSEEQATEAAARAATFTYNANWAMLAQDIPQYLLLGRSFRAAKKIRSVKQAAIEGTSKTAAIKNYAAPIGFDMISEGAEEAYQFMVGEEGMYMADIEAGIRGKEGFGERYSKYLTDGQLWTAATFGAFGAGVMQTAGRKVNDYILKSKGGTTENERRVLEAQKRSENISYHSKQIEAAAESGNEAAYYQAKANAAFDLGLNAAQAGNLDQLISNLEEMKGTTAEEKAQYNLGNDFALGIDELIEDVKQIGELYEKNGPKYSANLIAPITQSEFMVNKLSKQRPLLKAEIEEAYNNFPRITELSANGRAIFDMQINLSAAEKRIAGAEFILKNKQGLSAEEKEKLEKIVEEQKLAIEIGKTALKAKIQAQETELTDIDKKILDNIGDNPLTNNIVGAQTALGWADELLDAHTQRLKKLGSKEFNKEAQGIEVREQRNEQFADRLREITTLLTEGAQKKEVKLPDDIDSRGEFVAGKLVEELVPLTLQEKNELLKEAWELWSEMGGLSILEFTDGKKNTYDELTASEKERYNEESKKLRNDREALRPFLEKLSEVVRKEKDKYSRKERRRLGAEKAKLTRRRNQVARDLDDERARRKEIEDMKDPRYDDLTLAELFVDPTDVIPVIFKGELATLSIDPETNEYLVNDEIIIAGGGNQEALYNHDIAIPKDGYYPISLSSEGDRVVMYIGDHLMMIDTISPADSIITDEAGNITGVKLIDSRGNEVLFEGELRYDIADYLLIYDALLEEFVQNPSNMIIPLKDGNYLVEFNQADPFSSKVYKEDKNGKLREILPKSKLRKKDGSYNKKGRIVNSILTKFKEEVLTPLKGNPLNKNSNETNYENSPSEQIAGQEINEGLDEDVSEAEEPILAGSEEYLQLLEKIKVANDAELGDLIANIKELKTTLNPVEGGQLMVAIAKRVKELKVSTGEDTGALAQSSTGKEIQNQLDDQLTASSSINEEVNGIEDASTVVSSDGTEKNLVGTTEDGSKVYQTDDGVLIYEQSEEAKQKASEIEIQEIKPEGPTIEELAGISPLASITEINPGAEAVGKGKTLGEVELSPKELELTIIDGEYTLVLDPVTQEPIYTDENYQPDLSLLSNPNIGEDAEVRVFIDEKTKYWDEKKDTISPMNHYLEVPMYVEIKDPESGEFKVIGKLRAGEKFKAERQAIWSNYQKGEKTDAQVNLVSYDYANYSNTTSVHNLRNARTPQGLPLWQSGFDAFNTAWKDNGDGTFSLERKNAPLFVFSTIGSTTFLGENSSTPQLYLEETSDKMRRELGSINLTGAKGNQDGQVWTTVINPSGHYVPVKLSTSNLSQAAVDYVMSQIILGNFEEAQEVIYANYEDDQALLFDTFIQLNVNKATNEKYIKFKPNEESEVIYSIEYKSFREAIESSSGLVDVNIEEPRIHKGKTTLHKVPGKTVNIEIGTVLRKMIENKKYNIKNTELRTGRTYKSLVTEQEYRSYEHYLMGAPDINGNPNEEVADARDGRPTTILASDVRGTDGNFFFDVGMTFSLKDSFAQGQIPDLAAKEEYELYLAETKESDLTGREIPEKGTGYTKGKSDDLFGEGDLAPNPLKNDNNLEEGELGDGSFSLIDTGGERINMDLAAAWLNKRGLTFNESRQVLKLGHLDASTAGVFHEGLIYLSKNAEIGTEYHEAFHAVFRSFLTDAQQEQILKEAGTVTAAELKQRESEGYFTKKGGKIFKKTIRGEQEISKEELNNMILEERLAEQFRGYVTSNQKPSGLLSRVAKFFKDLLNYIKTYLTKGRTIDQLFSNIESGRINRRYTNKRFQREAAFSLKKGFTTSEQEEVLDTINIEFKKLYEELEQGVDPNIIYNNIRNQFLTSMFVTKDSTGHVTNPPINIAKKHYDLLSEGGKNFTAKKDANINVSAKWKIFGSIYKNWNTQFSKDELENPVENGWVYLAKRQLPKHGLKVHGDLTSELEDDIFEERIYGRNYAEESRKDSLSGKVKSFLSRVPMLIDGKPVKNILGTNKTVPFDEIYQEVAYTIINSVTFNDMLNKLRFSGNNKEVLNTVADMLDQEVSNKNWEFIADFYKNMSLTYLDFVGAIEEVDIVELEGGNQDVTIKIRYFNTNTNKSENRIFKKWNLESKRSDNKGLFSKDDFGTLKINQTKAANMKKALDIIQEIKNDIAVPEMRHITALSSFLDSMSIDIPSSILRNALDNGIKVGNKVLKSGELYRYLTSGTSSHSNNNVGIDTLLKNIENGKDPFVTDRSVINRFLKISKEFEASVQGSFINGEGKSIHPINMHTTLTRMFASFKNFNPDSTEFWNLWVRDFMEDPFYFPEGALVDSPNNSLFLSSIVSNKSKFKSILAYEEFDTYKKKNEITSQNTFENMSPLLSKLHRLNSFANNGSKRQMKIVLPTLADRSKMALLTIPRISYNKKLHQYKTKNIEEIFLGYVVQDLKRAQRVQADIQAGALKIESLHKHKESPRGLRFSQFEFLNETEAGQELLKYALDNSDDQLLYSSNDSARKKQGEQPKVYSLFKNVLDEIDTYVNNQVQEQLKDIREKNINSTQGRRKVNQIDPGGLALYENSVEDFIKDYVAANIIAKNEIIKMTAGDLALYKDYATTSKRYGGLATPGLEAFLKEFADGATYGDMATYQMGAVEDIFKLDSKNLDALEELAGKAAVKAYRKGSNKTDAMGLTTLAKHKAKMEGQGTWGDNHDMAYKNYLNTGKFSFTDIEGNTIKPKLSPIKTYHDGLYLQNGRIVRVLVKHSTMPLLEEFTKNHPAFDSLREHMELNKIDEINMDSGIKVGLTAPLKLKFDENGYITNLKDLYSMELNTRFQRIPQIIPESGKEGKIGSQFMKLLPANIKNNLDGKYDVAGVSMTGEELLEAYQDTIIKMIANGRNRLYGELGYSEYLKSNKDKGAKLSFLKKLRQVLRKSAESNDLPDNYINALDLKPIVKYLETGPINTYDFATPLGMPAYQKKYEQIIFSLFKKNLLRLGINGNALVQIAELGGFREQNGPVQDLNFVKNEEGRIISAEVALPYHLAEKLNLPKDENGEFDLSSVDPTLLEIIGYRIPTQGKNSMLPLKIKRVLPEAMGKAILVPGEITTQMGSDFDIDKLFLMFPNADIRYTTESGEKWNELGAFKSQLKESGFDLSDKEADLILKDPIHSDEVLRYNTVELDEAATKARDYINSKKKELGVKAKAVKVRYDIKNLKTGNKRGLENAFIDISNAVLTNPAHLSEMLQTVDSQTLPDAVKEIRKSDPAAFPENLDPQNVMTEEKLEYRNKVGKTGIAIEATALTGAAIGQNSKNLKLEGKSAIKFDSKKKTALNRTEDDSGNLITYLINKYLNLAVDNGKNPMMDVIEANPFTFPVINLIMRAGPTNKRLAVKGTELTGDASEVATWFVTQPIIRELHETYLNEEGNPGLLYNFVQKIGMKHFGKDWKMSDHKRTVNINSVAMKDFVLENKKIEDDLMFQENVLVNFFHYHKAGSMLNKLNRAYNSDRIKDMSSMAAIEEYMQVREELQDPIRNKYLEGFDDILEGRTWPISNAFNDAIMDAVTFADEFFPFMKEGILSAKRNIRKDLNKNNLTKDQIQAINNASMTWFYSQKQIPSPLSPLFSTEWEYNLLTGPNNIEIQYLHLRDLIEDAVKIEPNSELAKLADNKMFLSLDTHLDNSKVIDYNVERKSEIKEKFKHKILSFDYSYTLSAAEVSAISDDFGKLIYHESETVRNFAKNLVYYNILSKGFVTGIDSFTDIIPNEVWNDAEFSLQDDKISISEFYETYQEAFDNPNFWYGFSEEFIENNSHLRNLIPTLRSGKTINVTKEEIIMNEKSQVHNRDLNSFVRYFKIFDNNNKQYVLYKKVRDRASTATYKRMDRPTGVPFKLQQYNFEAITGATVFKAIKKSNTPAERLKALRKICP